ncbi:MAG: CbiQ family ECF transporter T component [Calditrichia bacterium]
MNSISLRYKFLLAFLVMLFAAWYQNPMYNISTLFILAVLLWREKIKVFRFAGQARFLMFFLVTIFLARSLNGYGKVLFELPFGLFLTDTGLQDGLVFITQILMIFLLCSLIIYSTPAESFQYYLGELKKQRSLSGRMLYRAGRILLLVMHLIPQALGGRSEMVQDLKAKMSGASLSKRLSVLADGMFTFLQQLLSRSDAELRELKQAEAPATKPKVLAQWKQMGIVLFAIGLHAFLLWGTV